jgi:hypothetical protein
MWIDLEDAGYRLEWYVSEQHGLDAPPPKRPTYDVGGGTPLPLAAPKALEREYRPIPGNQGNLRFLSREFLFRGLETEDGWIDSGEVAIVFDRDGTSTYAELILEGDDGEARTLEILPLADAVRVHHEEG